MKLVRMAGPHRRGGKRDRLCRDRPRSAGSADPCATIPPGDAASFGSPVPRAHSRSERRGAVHGQDATRTSGRDPRGRRVGRLPARRAGHRDPRRVGAHAGSAELGPGPGRRRACGLEASVPAERGRGGGVARARRRSGRRRGGAAGVEEGAPEEAAGDGGRRRGGTRRSLCRPDASRCRCPRHGVRGRGPGRGPGPLERDGLLAGRPDQRVVRRAHQHRPSDHPPARPALRPPDRGSPRRPGARLGGRLPRAGCSLRGHRRGS